MAKRLSKKEIKQRRAAITQWLLNGPAQHVKPKVKTKQPDAQEKGLIELEELLRERLIAEKNEDWDKALKLETQYRLRKKALIGSHTPKLRKFTFARYDVAYKVRNKAR
jgi:predicted acyl esterase